MLKFNVQSSFLALVTSKKLFFLLPPGEGKRNFVASESGCYNMSVAAEPRIFVVNLLEAPISVIDVGALLFNIRIS